MASTDPTDIILSGTSALAEYITNNPTEDTIIELVHALVSLSSKHPENALVYTIAFHGLKSEQLPEISVEGFSGDIVKEEFGGVLQDALYEALRMGMDIDPVIPTKVSPSIPFSTVDPSNTFLTTAILSGACAQLGLCAGAEQAGQALLGLQILDDYKLYGGDKFYEIRAIYACIQLLVAGKALIYAPTSQEKVSEALKKMESKGIIQHPGGQRLLKKAIEQSEKGFETLSPNVVWETLFPKE